MTIDPHFTEDADGVKAELVAAFAWVVDWPFAMPANASMAELERTIWLGLTTVNARPSAEREPRRTEVKVNGPTPDTPTTSERRDSLAPSCTGRGTVAALDMRSRGSPPERDIVRERIEELRRQVSDERK